LLGVAVSGAQKHPKEANRAAAHRWLRANEAHSSGVLGRAPQAIAQRSAPKSEPYFCGALMTELRNSNKKFFVSRHVWGPVCDVESKEFFATASKRFKNFVRGSRGRSFNIPCRKACRVPDAHDASAWQPRPTSAASPQRLYSPQPCEGD
jgi:hypothetical protein